MFRRNIEGNSCVEMRAPTYLWDGYPENIIHVDVKILSLKNAFLADVSCFPHKQSGILTRPR